MSVQLSRHFSIRPMRSADVPAIRLIERASYDYPWSERIFRDCLRVGYRAWVAAAMDHSVVGYCLLSIAAGESHVLNLCVAPAARRQGIAGLLLAEMIAQAKAENAEVMNLEVRPSNKTARRLYKRTGFVRIATRPNYYPARGGREDALLLSLRLNFS
jgi:ribosomal-protein-alanine N-acetyltransferase